MAKNHFLMKAHQYQAEKHFSLNNWWSVKLDGMRALWDGGITRGRNDVPWCPGEVATGLWSMNAKIIHAPDFWLDLLPAGHICDGELWAGPGKFQEVMSICRSHNAGMRWHAIEFVCYDLPSPGQVFIFRTIDDPIMKFKITMQHSIYFKRLAEAAGMVWYDGKGWQPPHLIEGLPKQVNNDYFRLLEHARVEGETPIQQENYLNKILEELVEEGHEGVMVRVARSLWRPVRSHDLTKLKPFNDAEATVIGVQFGRKTDLGSKHLGRMGALICDWNGKQIKVSGLTDEERHLTSDIGGIGEYSDNIDRWAAAGAMAEMNPGREWTDGHIWADKFPIGSKITFKYRELTDDGMPKDPRYWRNRPNE